LHRGKRILLRASTGFAIEVMTGGFYSVKLPKQARYQLRYTRINMILNWSVPAGALPVAVPGDCPRPFGLRPSPTAATRSAPFLRPRRRSPRSPTALHPDTWHYTTPEEKKQSKKLMLKKKWWGMQPTTSCSHTLYERVYKFFILLRAISANINAKTRR